MKRTRWSRLVVSQSMVGVLWCSAFLAGLALARIHNAPPLWIGIGLALFGILLRRKNRPMYIAITMLGLLFLGMWRGGTYEAYMQPYAWADGQKVTFSASVASDGVYGKQGQLSFTVRDIEFTKPFHATPPGMIRINGFGELAVFRGDRVRVEGTLHKTLGSNQAGVYFAQFSRIGGSTNILFETLRRFTAGVQTAIAEPAASFGMGLLVGQRTTLPQENIDSLKMVGLMHIVAVSGYNLTIIINFAKRACEKISKRLTIMVAVGMMLSFLVCTGMSASIVRASIVSGLGLLAWYVGRRVRPMLLILLTAAMTAGVYPVYLWSDIGWYLSFLAFYGILIIAPLVIDRIWRQKQPSAIRAIIVETLCAEIMTIPLVLYIFGQISSVGLIANLLVVGFIPVVMLLTFVAGVAGWFVPVISGWIGWPAQILLTYMLDVAQFLSRLPHAFTSGVYIHVYTMLTVYGAVFFIVFVLSRRKAWHAVWYNFYTPEPEKGIL